MKTNEMIAGLRNCVTTQFTGCKECPAYCRSANCLNRLHTAAADTLEAQQKRIEELEAERRWIPVTERRPTDADTDDKRGYGCVEVYSPSSGVDVASVDWVNDFVNDVTHWRPLPQPPKEV